MGLFAGLAALAWFGYEAAALSIVGTAGGPVGTIAGLSAAIVINGHMIVAAFLAPVP